jgi:hypothetical protein
VSPLGSRIGLFSGSDFRLTTGRCTDCAAIPQALWYFADEIIAAPRSGLPVAGFTRGVPVLEDLRRWAAAHAPDARIDDPPLIWIGSPTVIRGARLSSDGRYLDAAGSRWSFSIVPKLALNRSYYDDSSIAYLAGRTLSVRGRLEQETFTARTLWPEEFRLDGTAPLQPVNTSPEALRALVRAEPRGGAQSPFAATALWERHPGAARRWEDSPVLAVMLNGAQGDDDEAHAGHFALVTGRVGPGGAMGDWLANNFYRSTWRARRNPRQHGAARQLPRGPEQWPGLVSAFVPDRCGAQARARREPGARCARANLQSVLPATADL